MPTVLIAEADRDLRDAYVQFLARLGFEIDTAADGLECLSKLRRFLPDVLILDLELLWGGGEGVRAILRDETQLRRKRVVLSSAAASPHVPQSLAFLLGIRALTRPFPHRPWAAVSGRRHPQLKALLSGLKAYEGK